MRERVARSKVNSIHTVDRNVDYLIKPSVYSTLTGISLPVPSLAFVILNAHNVVTTDNQS